MVGIINYIGNIGSVKNAIDYLEIPNCIVNIPAQLKGCTHIIIPGVGNWAEGVKRLKPFYKYLKKTRKPILGICLGFQLMCLDSEEGKGKGLGLIPYNVIKLPEQHVGWEYVEDKCYYFVHGYAVSHGEGWDGEIITDNVTGVQWHPEKSQKDGIDYLERWYDETNHTSITD